MFDFSGKVVMVTGAAGNLGVAVARAFQGAVASLVLVDRARDRLPTLYPELVASSDHALFSSTDVTDSQAVGAMVEEVMERFARVDVLANTVGGYRAGAPVRYRAGSLTAAGRSAARCTDHRCNRAGPAPSDAGPCPQPPPRRA